MWVLASAASASVLPPAAGVAPAGVVAPSAGAPLSPQPESRPVAAMPPAVRAMTPPVSTLRLPESGSVAPSGDPVIDLRLSSLTFVLSARVVGSVWPRQRRGSRPGIRGRGCIAGIGDHRDGDALRDRLALFALEPALDLDRALLVAVVQHLAVQARDAFVGVDVAFRMDRFHRAFLEAAHARIAAFAVALEP